MLHNIELLSDEYIWSHRNVTAPFRFGPPSGILVATGRLAAAVRRLSAKIEGWAQSPAQSNNVPQSPAQVAGGPHVPAR